MDEFAEAWGGGGFFFLSSTPQSIFLFNATPRPLPNFISQQQWGCRLWTSLFGKTWLSRGSNAGRVQQISRATMMMINKALNEQSNSSWLCNKGANSPRWGTSIGCWQGSPVRHLGAPPLGFSSRFSFLAFFLSSHEPFFYGTIAFLFSTFQLFILALSNL